MATDMQEPAMRISKESQNLVVAYAKKILTIHKSTSDLRDKMTLIDQAYARYKATGVDTEVPCNGDIFTTDSVTPPIVVSQVDSLTAYQAEVFLSGYPIFPIVSTPDNRETAMQLETLLDDHALLGGYVRQLYLFLLDGNKYNFSAIEANWEIIQQYSVLSDFTAEDGRKVKDDDKYFTRLNRLDPYNVVWDQNVSPADVPDEGDYAGYIKLVNKVKLKKLLNRLTKERNVYNARAAEAACDVENKDAPLDNYTAPPEINKNVSARVPLDTTNWDAYLTGADYSKKGARNIAGNFEVFTFYARIVPADFMIQAPKPNTPQIWKFIVLNGSIVIHAKRIISAKDQLPIFFGQPKEDGLGILSQSSAEGAMEFQNAASTLYNIRFAAARRAVSDRALYDPTHISPTDINSKAAAPKIPVKLGSGALGKSFDQIYRQLPFDIRGTETTIQDAMMVSKFAEELAGLNNAQRGQFQKGNKSVKEWDDVMGASDNRLRMSALLLEYQVFVPIKYTLALNIFQYGDNTIVVSQTTGEVVKVDIAALRKAVLSFKIADGYTPKSKLASSEMLQAGMQMIMASPILQQSYGNMLPSIFAHMMELGGVRGLNEYIPKQPQQPLVQGLSGGPQNAA